MNSTKTLTFDVINARRILKFCPYYDDIINYALDLGVKNAYIQEGDTSDKSFIPPFDLEGL